MKQRHRRGHRGEGEGDFARGDRHQRGAAALERHMGHVGAGQPLEDFACQVVQRAVAGRGVGDLPRFFFGQPNQILQVVHGGILRHHDGVGDPRQQGDGREPGGGVVGQLVVGAGADGKRPAGNHHQGVTVGRGLMHHVGGDGAARAAAVIDHHRLPPCGRELRAQDARENVGRAAGRKADNNADRLGRVIGRGILGRYA